MFKKAFFILILIAAAGFMIYKISKNVFSDEVDKANEKAVELYANTVKLSTVNLNNIMNEDSTLSYDDKNVGTSVKCEKVNVSATGIVELFGCTVDGSKTKYKYTNGKAKRE